MLIPPTSTLPLRGCPVAVLDFETTGVDPAECEPVQVAIVHVELGTSTPVVAFQSLIRPRYPIPDQAAAVHGITDERVVDAPGFADVLPDILDALEGRALAAYNLPFDHAVLRASIARTWGVQHADLVPFGSLCAFVLAREIDKFEKGKRLGDVAARRGLTFDAHDAGADAFATARLLPVLLRELGRGRGRNGPWCRPSDLASVDALWGWTCRTGVAQEADLAAFFAREGRTLDSRPWTDHAEVRS